MNTLQAGRDLAAYLRLQAQRTPKAPALIGEGECWRYETLDRRVEQLAAELVDRLGEGPWRVGVQVGERRWGVLAMLAIFRAGMVYVPLDPTLPAARRGYMIDDCAMACVLVDAQSEADDVFRGERSLPVWRIEGEHSTQRTPLAERVFDEAAPAYLLYTSGSTGQPKGVEMTRRALCNLIDHQLESGGAFTQPLKTLLFASPGFDVSVQEVLSAVACGGVLHTVPPDVRQDLSRLYAFIQANEVQRCFLPYSVLQALAIAHERRVGAEARVCQVISAGEALQLTPQIIDWLQGCGCELINHYGPTETHVVTQYHSTRPLNQWPSRVPIGQPIANVQAFVLDAQLQVMPEGAEGELCLAGVCLANGYAGRAEETARRFPTWRSPEGESLRLYRTGDRVMRDASGDLLYLGRMDTQVKINGQRVELAEIEANLKRDPTVREAVVLADSLTGHADGQLLVAFMLYASAHPGEPDATPLARIAPWVEALPVYMRPQRVVVIDRLPLTTNGKVDQRALLALSQAPRAVQASLSAEQARVAQLFARLLKVTVTDADMDFFAQGGNSLLAIRFVQLVERECGVRLDMTAFLSQPTIAHVATYL
ncbi:MAG: peptide synthetase [Pseudomonas sp.]|jgi:amino acid adenylation domain-containing protein|uniref:non-ribosomal peptide synthetase n=1 Tax=Pseudomonas entomophila TaxID=312306 RepID=UPI0015E317AB|nr:non-ribosomal peptide synthetase [Pseudomonas entomophila]MBA1194331.1 non-ribosomal peptide synthetase [Pseudomonas entomophila]MDF2488527.1 peptide synthetase [Pseudomonas sp.]